MPRALPTLLVLVLLGGVARAQPRVPPAPTRWVTDTVGFLSPETRGALDRKLEAYQRQTGHQVVVWIGSSIGDADLADWAVRTFAAWKLGREGEDDGLALFILAGDRKVAIEVGYGLEGDVPDAVANRVIQEIVTPRLRAGDRDGAVRGAVDALLTAIEGRPVPEPAGATEPSRQLRERPGVGQLVVFGVLALAFLVLLIVNPRLAIYFLWSIASGAGHRHGGGGFGGGGFGGGGGRSGGGGARGSW
jgi:uncharacterized protein